MSDIVEECRALVAKGDASRLSYGEVLLATAADEIERLRERLGPRGLEVVMIDGAGHYVNETVKAEIERLRAEVVRVKAELQEMKDEQEDAALEAHFND